MGQVRRTPRARADLKAIARYIAHESHSLDAAVRFLDAFAQKSAQYAREPQLGEARPTLGTDVRVLHGNRDIRVAWRQP